MIVRANTKTDFPGLLKMARALWPEAVGLKRELGDRRFRYFVAEDKGGLVGFIVLTVRRDYVEGSTTSPVGYVEGLYVEEGWRGKDVGRELVKAAEKWCAEKGLKELGSDVEHGNKASQKFHSKVGFVKGDLIVPYLKKIKVRRNRRTS